MWIKYCSFHEKLLLNIGLHNYDDYDNIPQVITLEGYFCSEKARGLFQICLSSNSRGTKTRGKGYPSGLMTRGLALHFCDLSSIFQAQRQQSVVETGRCPEFQAFQSQHDPELWLTLDKLHLLCVLQELDQMFPKNLLVLRKTILSYVRKAQFQFIKSRLEPERRK